jgi:hypothetical protein
MVTDLWLVWFMMALSEAPAIAVGVANPDLRL